MSEQTIESHGLLAALFRKLSIVPHQWAFASTTELRASAMPRRRNSKLFDVSIEVQRNTYDVPEEVLECEVKIVGETGEAVVTGKLDDVGRVMFTNLIPGRYSLEVVEAAPSDAEAVRVGREVARGELLPQPWPGLRKREEAGFDLEAASERKELQIEADWEEIDRAASPVEVEREGE